MNSAIEVLKNWKSKMAKKVNIAFTQEEYNALGEALLALEQKEEWLSDIQMLKAENKELKEKLSACESRCYNLEGELNEL